MSHFSNAQSWELITPPKFRDFNDLAFVENDHWIAIGGNEFNDAISTIAISKDGGDAWNLIEDNIAAQYMDIQSLSATDYMIVGWDGLIKKSNNSGETWNAISLPSNAAFRNYNAIHMLNNSEGIAVGGNFSNDSIQTIIRTIDQGETWTIIRDNLGGMLRDVHFISDKIGFIVGDLNTILMTTDGGLNWTAVNAPNGLSSRSLASVHFIDNTSGFIVGGNPSMDSIQTMLSTSDGGNSWSIVSDKIGSMFRDVQFRTDNNGFVVGDKGTIKETQDAGMTWQDLILPMEVNDTFRDLRNIIFNHPSLGMFSGAQGKIIKYQQGNSELPVVVTLDASLSLNNVRLKADIETNDYPATVFFDYGTDLNIDTRVEILQSPLSSNFSGEVYLDLNNLVSNQMYFYRIVAQNDFGESLGDVKQFFYGNNIPNFDFEFWDSTLVTTFNTWTTLGDLSPATSYNNTTALRMATNADGPGAIIHGSVGDTGLSGGIPYPFKPDSLSLYSNHSIEPDDAALIICQLKDINGNIVSDNLFMIQNSSAGAFERFSFPLEYTGANMPDTLFLAIVTTNAFAGPNPLSWMEIDDVQMIGAAVGMIPNGNFEDFESGQKFTPLNWKHNSREDRRSINRTKEHQQGDFAIELKGAGMTINLRENDNIFGPAFKVENRHQMLSGHIKFFPENNDTLLIETLMFLDGNQIGYNRFDQTTELTNFEEFQLPIQYFNNTVIPDSANIIIRIINSNSNNSNSIAIVDNLNYDGIISSVKAVADADEFISVYPNPTNGFLQIDIDEKLQKNQATNLVLYNSSGKIIYKGAFKNTVDISNNKNGIYYLLINFENTNSTKKIIKID